MHIIVRKSKTSKGDKGATLVEYVVSADANDMAELEALRGKLEALIDKWLAEGGAKEAVPVTERVAPAAEKVAEELTVEKVSSSFPEELRNILAFEDKGDRIVIKPRAFLGSDRFAEIAGIMRNLGGEYISAGKESRFEVLKKRGA